MRTSLEARVRALEDAAPPAEPVDVICLVELMPAGASRAPISCATVENLTFDRGDGEPEASFLDRVRAARQNPRHIILAS